MEEKFWEELGIAVQIVTKDYSGHKYYFPIGEGFNEKSLTANAGLRQQAVLDDIEAISAATFCTIPLSMCFATISSLRSDGWKVRSSAQQLAENPSNSLSTLTCQWNARLRAILCFRV